MLLHAGLDFLDTSSSAATGRIGVFPCVYTIHRLYVLRELRPHLEGFVAPITLQRAMLCRHGDVFQLRKLKFNLNIINLIQIK